jgi:hypothetical protein
MRTTATAVMAQANICCGVVMWLMVPLVVTTEDEAHLMLFNYICLGAASVTLILALAHFPARPAQPPSASAGAMNETAPRITPASLWASLKAVMTSRDYLPLFLVYSLLEGYASAFVVLLPKMLSLLGFDQSRAAYVGFAADVAGMVFAIVLARVADSTHNPRRILVLLLGASALAGAWFTLLIQGWVQIGFEPGSIAAFAVVAAAFAGVNLAASSAGPLVYEMGVEYSFGHLPEGSAIMVLNTGLNVVTSISLFLPMDSLGVLWMPWTYCGVLVTCVVCVLLSGGENKRSDFDRVHAVSAAAGDGYEPLAAVAARVNG